jgi:chemotaxis family two-component system response regulator Rcp1
VLAVIKQDGALRDMPVVILTSSSAPGDVASAYDARANCYVAKPVELDQYLVSSAPSCSSGSPW